MKTRRALYLAMVCVGAALPIGSATPFATAQAAGSADAYGRCIGCHSLDRDRTGPHHCGLLGRAAGSVPGFGYSAAMRELDIVWNRDTVDAFLRDPTGFVPGTSMGYAGIDDPAIRREIIDYIDRASDDPSLCPRPTG